MSGKVSDNIGRGSGSITEPSGGIEILSSDPTLTEGLVWYNSTSNVLKVARTATAWSTENALLTAVKQHGGCGTVSAGLSFGGYNAAGSRTTESEEFDGTTWAADDGNLGTATNTGVSFGTQTAGLYGTGYSDSGIDDRSELYDGSTWSAGGDLQEGMSNTSGFGTQTAGVRHGGEK